MSKAQSIEGQNNILFYNIYSRDNENNAKLNSRFVENTLIDHIILANALVTK
jgi:hypothetical protein